MAAERVCGGGWRSRRGATAGGRRPSNGGRREVAVAAAGDVRQASERLRQAAAGGRHFSASDRCDELLLTFPHHESPDFFYQTRLHMRRCHLPCHVRENACDFRPSQSFVKLAEVWRRAATSKGDNKNRYAIHQTSALVP